MLPDFDIQLAAAWKKEGLHSEYFCEMYLVPLCNNLLRGVEEKSKSRP